MNKNDNDSNWWSRWLDKAEFLAVLSAIAAALYMTNDNYIMKNVITGSDNTGAALVFLLLGSWAGVLISLVNNVIFGHRVDSDYPGMHVGSKRMQLMAVVAGFFGAISTGCYLKASQDLDPSIVVALASLYVVYLVIYDTTQGNINWKQVWTPLIATIIGGFLVSRTSLDPSISLVSSGGALLLLVVGRSGLTALGKIVEQKGSRSSDGVTFSFWRMFWFAVVSTMLGLGYSIIRGELSTFGEILRSALPSAIPWISLSLFFAYFGNTLENTAKRFGAVSIVAMFVGLQTVLGVPLTLIVEGVSPGALGDIPSGVSIWLVRTVGALSLFWGINKVRKVYRRTSG